jgi:hypothetical protein
MPEGHIPFVDRKEAYNTWEKNKSKWLKYLAAHYAKTAAKSALASAVNHFTFNVAGAIFEAAALVWTSRHNLNSWVRFKTMTRTIPRKKEFKLLRLI